MSNTLIAVAILATLVCVVIDVIFRLRAFRAAGRKMRAGEMLRITFGRGGDIAPTTTRMIRISMLARLGSYAGIVVVLVRLASV